MRTMKKILNNIFVLIWALLWVPIIVIFFPLIFSTFWVDAFIGLTLTFISGFFLLVPFIMNGYSKKKKISDANELEKYAKLRNKGIITEKEYLAKKKKLLNL